MIYAGGSKDWEKFLALFSGSNLPFFATLYCNAVVAVLYEIIQPPVCQLVCQYV
jgi:hypothetical protein